MPQPILTNLPVPPPGKTGWPWTEQSDPLPEAQPDGSPWPKISIVTPSYNQGQFIEETIRSILLQGYPNLEYIVMDGRSDDETVSILEKYDPWIDYWVSEADRGQSHAINKGIDLASGKIFNWINSDDYLAKDALYAVATQFSNAKNANIVAGYDLRLQHENDKVVGKYRIALSRTPEESVVEHVFTQPPTFFRLDTLHKLGPLNEKLNFIMDTELFIRYLIRFGQEDIILSDSVLSYYRLHKNSKTVAQSKEFRREYRKVLTGLMNILDKKFGYMIDSIGVMSIHTSMSGVNLSDLYGQLGIKKIEMLTGVSVLKQIICTLKIILHAPRFFIKRWRFIAGAIRKSLLKSNYNQDV